MPWQAQVASKIYSILGVIGFWRGVGWVLGFEGLREAPRYLRGVIY